MMRRTLIVIAILLLKSLSAQTNKPEKLNNLIVYGKGFAFSVKEPAQWRAETEDAGKYGANVVFFPRKEKRSDIIHSIRVYVGTKVDENIAEDLKVDMDEYRKKNPAIEFVDIRVDHPKYKIVSKLFLAPHRSCEYVAYLNPGPDRDVFFSVSMSKPGEPATDSEMEAFREVVSSLTLLSK